MAEKQYEPKTKIEPIEGLDAQRQVQLDRMIDSSLETDAVSKAKFDEAIKNADTSRIVQVRAQEPVQPVTGVPEAKKPSLLELAASHRDIRTESAAPIKQVATAESIKEQAAELRKSFEKPRATLIEAGSLSQIPADTSKVLTTHIEHADTALKEAASSVSGVEKGSLIDQNQPPAMKFLKFLTDGDSRLSTIIDDISKLNLNTQKMTPQLLMAVQIKMGFVQQELEFFTNVLNKSLESTKTIMNVQI